MKRKLIKTIAMVLTLSAVSGCFISEKCYAGEEKETVVSESNEIQSNDEVEVKSQKQQYIEKLDKMYAEAECNISNHNQDIWQITLGYYDGYKQFEEMLNEILEVLRKQLPENEVEKLNEDQNKWKIELENHAGNGSSVVGRYVTYRNFYNMTKDRCYYLVQNYMK